MEKIILRILEKIIDQLSPGMRDAIKKGVLDLEHKAKETPNPWDDIFIVILKAALGIE